MKRERILQIFLPFLVVVALVVWVRGLGSFRKKGPPGAFDDGSLALSPRMPSSDILTRARLRSSYREWGRNPFEIYAEKSQKSVLSGILWDRGNPQAMIDGEIVGIGTKAGLYTVVDIQNDRVILNDGAKDFEIILGGGRE
jgi:hypothetical protein